MAKYLDQAGLTAVLTKINEIYQRKITLLGGAAVNDNFVTGLSLTQDATGTGYTLTVSHAQQKYDVITASYNGTGMSIATIAATGTGSDSLLSIAYASDTTGGVLTNAQAAKLASISAGASSITVTTSYQSGIEIANITVDSTPHIAYVPIATNSQPGVVAIAQSGGIVINNDNQISVDVAALGLSGALKWTGQTVNADPTTTTPTGTFNTGDVITYEHKEYAYTGTGWQELGDESSFALKTLSVNAGTGLSGGGQLKDNPTISLKTASTSEIGGIKITALTSKAADRDYNVGITSAGVAYVNIPWTDTQVTSVANHYKTNQSWTGTGTSYNYPQTPNAGETFNIPVLSYDAAGHITAVTTNTVTLPDALSVNDGTLIIGTGTVESYTSVASHSANTSSNVSVIFTGSTSYDSGNSTYYGNISISGDATNHSLTFSTTATSDSALTTDDIDGAWAAALAD